MNRVNMMSIMIAFLLISLAVGIPVLGQGIDFAGSTLHHNTYKSAKRTGEYLYCGGTYGIHIFDISDSSDPNLVGIYDFPLIHRMYIDGNIVLLIARSPSNIPGLRVLDITDPLNPHLIGSLDHDFEFYASEVYYQQTIFSTVEAVDSLGGAYSKVFVVDVSDPYNPSLADTLHLPLLSSGLWASDGFLHASSTAFGFWATAWSIYSLDNPSHPVHLSNMNFGPGLLEGLFSCQNYVYLNFETGLSIYDYSDIYNPSLVRIDDSGLFNNMLVIDETIGYAASTNSILTFDMSDPVYPEYMGGQDFPDGLYMFSYAGDTSFVTGGTSAFNPSVLSIIDFSNPYQPSILGEHRAPGVSYDVQLSEDYAYVANGISGLTVVNVADPEAPVVLDSYGPQRAKDVFIQGD